MTPINVLISGLLLHLGIINLVVCLSALFMYFSVSVLLKKYVFRKNKCIIIFFIRVKSNLLKTVLIQ